MDLHDNAGTTPHSRSLMVRWLSSAGPSWPLPLRSTCAPKAVRKWRDRYARQGDGGSRDRSCRLPEYVGEWIEALRRQCLSGPVITPRLPRPTPTGGLILRRCGLGGLRALDRGGLAKSASGISGFPCATAA